MSTLPFNETTTLSVPALTSEYNDVTTASKAIETIVMVVIMIITTVGNVCLWVVVLRSRALRSLTSMFILGLSTADILVGVVNMPITVYTIIMGRWEFSHSACVVFGFLNMITLVTSVLSLCNISINRYVMVCYPQMFKNIYTVKNAVSMVIGVVIFSILLSVPPLIGWSEYVYTPSHSFCFADWQNHMSYAFFMIGCCFGIPFTVMSVCNVFILRTVRASRLRVKTSSEPQQSPASIKTSINRLMIGIKSERLPTEHTRVTFKSVSSHMYKIERKIKIKPLVTDINKVSNNKSTHSKSELKNDFSISANTISVIDEESLPSSTLSTEPLKTPSTVSSLKVRMTSKIVPTKVGQSTTTLHTPSSQSTKSSLTRQQRSRFLHPDWKPASENTPPGKGSPVTAISLDPSSDVSFVLPSNSKTEFNAQGPVYDKQMSKPKVQETPPLKRREEIRLAFSLIIVVVVFVICWLPYCIIMLLSIFHSGHVPREFHMFTIILGYANSCCNPIIYGVMNTRFKVGFKRIFCFWQYRTSSGLSSP